MADTDTIGNGRVGKDNEIVVNVHFNLPSDLPPPDLTAKLDALAKTAKDLLVSRGYRRIEIIGSPTGPSNSDLTTTTGTAAASPARSSSSSIHSLSPSINSDHPRSSFDSKTESRTTVSRTPPASFTNPAETIFSLDKLSCSSCVQGLERVLKNIEGVDPTSILVMRHPKQKAEIIHDVNIVSAESIKSKIEGAGTNTNHTYTP
ncbi:hypothetical protein HK102_009674 [Quaeritorhiza haematococci]|nr:hypothetical protein HK102_009674 [Quaeritorhiza haematococci]